MRPHASLPAVLCLLCVFVTPLRAAPAASPLDRDLSSERIAELTAQAFYWGLNIAGFYELRYLYTQFEEYPAFSGLNRVKPNKRLFDASVRIATTVNASTLYSGGAFDVSQDPIVVEAGAVDDGRYWSVQAADQYANWFFMVGSQFTGNAAQRYLIVGPHWHGTLPAGFRSTEIVRASSDSFSLATRVAVTTRDEQDMQAAGAVIDNVRVAPLALWLRNGGRVPPLEEQPIVKGDYRNFERMRQLVDYGKSMRGVDLLQLLSLALNDPALTLRSDSVTERATLAELEPLGLRKGFIFDPAGLSEEQRTAIEAGFTVARRSARSAMEKSLIDMNGWKLQSSLFHDDLDYVAKAGADDVAWGTPVPYQSHSIAYVFRDSEGRPLDGRHRYILSFDLAALPPVTEFWELPVYDEHGYFIDNPIDRYSLTSYLQQAGTYHQESGKLVFYLQAERPADPEQARNWLPIAASGGFQLAARFYGPMAPLIDGSYAMPAIVRVGE
ncbi:MAG: DUF1254 domain-containing protein [Pseudomonadales bacterium]|jgi:hypothetical protein|nr:DUF1254 domain-containing protein [Pseudomonadales bacterium]MCP5320027.1 DUF1254 domain-containing protein [Pseudomonadales bacterium]MCP5338226.1 DUF1254 domain-containing protein [Pseudomonadales bacterium]